MQADLIDDYGNPLPQNGQHGGSNPDRPPSFDAGSALADLEKRYGVKAGETDLANLSGKNTEDRDKFLSDLGAQFSRRAAPTFSGGGSGGDADRDGNKVADAGWAQGANGQWAFGGSAASGAPSGGASRQATNVPGQFSDPIAKYLEQFAQLRAQQLEQPPQGSGQNLFEETLKRIAGQFQTGGYTPEQQDILNTQAMEPIDQMRAARKQQVMVQLSQRGIDPNSGVGRQMLADLDRQFDTAKIQQRRALASQGVNEQQTRMLQAVQLLSQLAQTENTRLDSAYNYRTVPLNLDDRAFNRASSLYNMGGNPLSLINPLMQLQSSQQSQQNNQGAALADLIWMLTRGEAA